MTAVLGSRVETQSRTLSEILGGTFVSLYMISAFGAVPVSGRMAGLMVSALGMSTLIFYTKEQLGRIRLSLPILALIGWTVASMLWSTALWRTRYQIELMMPNTLLLLCIVSVLPLEQVARSMLHGVYVTVGITYLGLVLQPGVTLVDENGYRSVHGYFVHKNAMAPYMAMVVGLTLAVERNPRYRRTMVWLAVILLLTSLSATGLIALAAVMGFDWLAKNISRAERDRQTQIVLGALAGGITFAFLWVTYLPQIVAVYGKDTTLSGRTEIWRFALWAIRRRPILGYGFDAAWQPPSVVVNNAYAELGHIPTHAHQGILELTLSLGLIGAVLFVILFAGTWQLMSRFALAGSDLARAAWGIMTMLVAVSITESVFSWPWIPMLFVFRIVGLRMRSGETESAA